MKINLAKSQTVFLATCAILMVWFLGSNQIIEMNEYMGMRNLSSNNFGLFFSLIYVVVLFIIFFNSDQNTPQGIVIGILLFYSFIWFFAFYSVSGYTDARLIILGGFLFLVPMLMLLLTEKYLKINYGMKFFRNGLIKIRVEFAITFILILVSILMYKKIGISFSFIDSYERRMIAREEVHGFLAYLFAMSLNGLAPLLAFLAIYNRRYIYLMIALVFVFLGFGFVGTKAPIAFVILMSLLAIYFARGGENIVLLFVATMTSLIFLALVEYIFFGFSWIADIYVRRAILVVPQIQMYFLDFMFGGSSSSFDFLNGTVSDKPVTFVIGDVYMGNPETNANTITFLTEMGRSGILGYFLNVLFLVVFYSILAHLYKSSKHSVWLAISTLYALILLEQSYSTAFVTSGIAISTTLLLIFRYQRKKNN